MQVLNNEGWNPPIHQPQWNRLASLMGYACWTLMGLSGFSPIAQAAPNNSQTVQPEARDDRATALRATPDVPAEAVAAVASPSAPVRPAAQIAIAAADKATPFPPKTQSSKLGNTPSDIDLRAHFESASTAANTEAPGTGSPQAAGISSLPLALEPSPTNSFSESARPSEGLSTSAATLAEAIAASPEPDIDSSPAVAATEPPVANYQPLLQFQAATIYLDDELSGRLRASAIYALNPQVMFGATVDLVGGEAFVDSADEGLSLNELYVAAAPFADLPNLRFVGGLIDLTSYFDRNSFAKDVTTHFFNPVFQTNPALSSAGLGSRPGLLVNWSATDQLEFKAVAFSSDRDLGDLALDGFAAEAGYRSGNFIVRGTFATDRDAGDDTGFTEIFQIQRSDGSFGPREDDREIAYGLNAEYFIESINLGLFGRFGWYENQDLDRSGTTLSLGANALDLFLAGDRLGLGYGRQLSDGDLQSGKTPDVWEIFYDAPVYSNIRAGISLQSRDEFSDTSLGLRVRADW